MATTFRALFAKGDEFSAKDYRPIVLIPAMANPLRTGLHRRRAAGVDPEPSEEQFGVRPGRGCAHAVDAVRTVV
eukprot:2494976-Pyramimonas_sp.AAC.1